MDNGDELRSGTRHPTISGGVHFNGNSDIKHTKIAGRDLNENHIDARKRNIRIGIGSLVLLVLLGGGFWIYNAVSASAQDVVYQSGLQGATGTAAQLRQAEIDQNADRWCFLASSTSGSMCQGIMSNSFSATNSKRSQVSQVQLGAATGDDTSAQVPVLFGGKTIGQLPLTWSGSRWQLSSSIYPLAVNDGGVLMAAIATENGCGELLGISLGCR